MKTTDKIVESQKTSFTAKTVPSVCMFSPINLQPNIHSPSNLNSNWPKSSHSHWHLKSAMAQVIYISYDRISSEQPSILKGLDNWQCSLIEYNQFSNFHKQLTIEVQNTSSQQLKLNLLPKIED